ncbi:glycoside hydrolase family 44 protein [Paenibacillus koleovorans]|uniref:glycoside hydrolase family 44 protein n=1 Tax=Paenibacillus koleovorans TaxID=121608 RepID=UPI000FD8E7E5|nr:glycoside hydrolase family 44 protein [Paenibacillus koleovorans]
MARAWQWKKATAKLTAGLLAASLLIPAWTPGVSEVQGASIRELTVYKDSISSEFVNYSWMPMNDASTEQVHSGTAAMQLDPDEGKAMYLYKDRVMNVDEYDAFRFWIHGGTKGGQSLKLVFSLGGGTLVERQVESFLPGGVVPAGKWTEVNVGLKDIGLQGLVDGIWLWGAGDQEPIYLDDMAFVTVSGEGTPSGSPPPTATPIGTPAGTPTAAPTATPGATPTVTPTPTPTPSSQPRLPIEPMDGRYVYADAIGEGFSDFGWATHSLDESGTVHTGGTAIRFETRGDDALYFYSDRFMTSKEYEKLTLWLNGGATGGQQLKLVFMLGGQPVKEVSLNGAIVGDSGDVIPADTWVKAVIMLPELELPNQLFDGLLIAGVGATQGTVYLDDIALVRKYVAPPAVVEVRMDRPQAVLLPGEAHSLTAESFLETGVTADVTQDAVWVSDRPDVVRVEKGQLTAATVGIAKITATFKGHTAVAYVQVAEIALETVYDDALKNGFRNFSWHDKDLANAEQRHGGSYAVKFEPDGWDGVWFSSSDKRTVSEYYGVEFWLHGGTTGGQELMLHVYNGGSAQGTVDLSRYVPNGSIPAGQWTQFVVNFADMGLHNESFDGLIFQAATEANQAAVYIDDVSLLRNTAAGQLPQPELPSVQVTVDKNADRRAINPDIYGINFDDTHPTESKLAFPVQRWGGNNTTRYNWELDVANRASDWYFMNYPYEHDKPSQLPNGSMADRFMDNVLSKQGKVLLTIPTIGWTPKSREITYGFSQNKYGLQSSWATELPDAGNGVVRGTYDTLITNNDPFDTSKRVGVDFATRWIDHIADRTGNLVHDYALDNEPEIWHVTHRDVHPNPPTYDEIWGFTEKYGAAIKAKDSQARVYGPTSWGWCAYFYSSADNCAEGPDRAAHGGVPFLEWYLQKIAAYKQQTGVTLVDYLDIHYYSQENNVPTDDEGPAAVKRRFQALKSLYDPNFVDQSWIQEPIRLIPRMKEMIARHMPSTKLAITEYNFGNGNGVSAGLAQAEALAIFGREGVDLATRFGTLPAGTPLEDAFKLYLDYDGKGSRITGQSVRTTSTLPDAVGAYTIVGTDGRTYVLLFNKDTAARSIDVAGTFTATDRAEVYRFDASSRLAFSEHLTATANGFTAKLKPMSAALVVLP